MKDSSANQNESNPKQLFFYNVTNKTPQTQLLGIEGIQAAYFNNSNINTDGDISGANRSELQF